MGRSLRGAETCDPVGEGMRRIEGDGEGGCIDEPISNVWGTWEDFGPG